MSFAQEAMSHSLEKKQPIANSTCINCHQQSHEQWSTSDHAKSMAIANSQNVLANFDDVQVEHYGQKAIFYRQGEQYYIDIAYDDNSQTLPILYTFGHYPLQQYLVETDTGRLQVLPFAWDSRTIAEGGQRWYHNYSHEEIRPEDRLHWRQPLQNWNGMCADCHSDGLTRNYDGDKNSFATEFDNINVGCLSCHGNMTEHIPSLNEKNEQEADGIEKHLNQLTGQWLKGVDDKVASWQGPARDNSFMDKCFACHALRSPLVDGIDANKAFLDQFSPQLLSTPNYYADGQIKEEVYVYGSFLQSKMYGAGVNCLDCHDKHTMKIKVEGNGLCLQCHSAQAYQVKSHHQHFEDSAGSQCVNCHMPTNRYMGVDDRRDHSFKVPRPHLSTQYDTPNACTSCHQDKDDQWAEKTLQGWHGKANNVIATELDFIKLQAGQSLNLENHLSIIADGNLPVITRASALQLISRSTQIMSVSLLKPYIEHDEPLLRIAAANAANLLAESERIAILTPLLDDKLKAVRIAAANTLVNSHNMLKDNQFYIKAFNELNDSYEQTSWRGEGRLNQGLIAVKQNNLSAIEKHFSAAIDIDPNMEAPYINLADFYRSQQREDKVKEVLTKGLSNLETSASLRYAYGLHLIRVKSPVVASVQFKKAMELDKQNPQYLYTYALSLDGLNKTQQGVKVLQQYMKYYEEQRQLKELGMYFGQKLQSKAVYDWFNR